jgi:hypothetical protein
MSKGDLRERVQGVDAEFRPVLHKDRVDDLLEFVAGAACQDLPLAKPTDLGGKLLAYLVRAVEKGLGGDEALENKLLSGADPLARLTWINS